MRIVTWNCRRGPLEAKISALKPFGADILVLTEASRPDSVDANVLWFGHSKYGVAVCAKPPFSIRALADGTIPCVYPVAVTGRRSFTLFAVWTWEAPSYQLALLNGLRTFQSMPKPWVVAGDFNGNVKFDRPRSRKTKWSESFSLLESSGLVSAYHAFANCAHGSNEEQPTHYFRTHEDKPFHLDYCFIPKEWQTELENVQVSGYADFAPLSDHRPISVSLRTA